VSADILDRVRAFVRETFMYAQPDAALPDDALLLERGIIDSMGVVELVGFLQEEFGIDVEDSEITEDNLGSLRTIDAYVRAKLDGSGGN